MWYRHKPGICWSSQQGVILRREIHNFELQPFYPVIFSGAKLNVEIDLPQRITWLVWRDAMETCVLSPDFGQIRRWAVREMGLGDYTWKISEAALHGEFGLDCPCIFNYSRLYRRLKVRVCLVHGGDIPTLESPLDYKYVSRVYGINNNSRSTQNKPISAHRQLLHLEGFNQVSDMLPRSHLAI